MIIKEHKLRYQEEQHQRFTDAQYYLRYEPNVTLKEFAAEYNDCIRIMVEYSHGFKSPKIDANYDDYDYKKVNPITSSIFYYFFSASQASRAWANVILSAAKFPNERIRRP